MFEDDMLIASVQPLFTIYEVYSRPGRSSFVKEIKSSTVKQNWRHNS